MRAFAQAPSAESPTPGNGSTFSLGALAAMLVCAAAFLGIGAPAASAAPEVVPGWSPQATFGELSPFTGETSQNVLAVDGSGNIFGVNQNLITTYAYGPDGSLLGEYNFGGGIPRNIAIDPTDDALYVDEFFGGSVTRYVSDGAPTPSYSVDPGFGVPRGAGFAVDPTSHDILVADPGAGAVHRYDTSGALVETIITPSISPYSITTAPDGSFYVAPEGGGDVTHFSGAGTVLGTISGVGALTGMAFVPTDELLVVSVGDELKTYSASGQFLSKVLAGSNKSVLASAASGRLYGVSSDIGVSNPITAYVSVTVPGVEAPVVSNLEDRSAHVSAEVDPGAGPPEDSVAHFEYSSDNGLNWTPTPDQSVKRTETEGPDTIEADLTGLELTTEYLVRVKASNGPGGSATSAETSFRTREIAPLVETGAAGDRSQTSAMLYGTVNPAGLQTTYHFEYGTTTSYGSRAPLAAEAPAGNRRVPRSVSKLISGLQPGTTYHYRLVAENVVGTTNGADRTFNTLESSEAFPHRDYEQVTPVDKGGAAVLSDFHVHASDDGSAIAVNAVAASKDSQSALIFQNYLSRRGSADWLDWEQIDPPQDGVAGLNESATAAISEDFEHALVISNRALAPGGIPGGGNLFVKNLVTGDYTFVGGAPGDNAWARLTGIQANERIFLAGAPDFSWIVFFAEPGLLPSVESPAVYRWTRSTGALSVESLLPDNTVPPSFLSAQQPSSGQLVVPSVSSDGQVIGYGLAAGGGAFPVGVYRRANGQTMPVSASKIAGDSTEAQPAYFDGMSADGRYVFFHGPVRLTDDAPVLNLGESSLYRYDATTDTLMYVGFTSGSGSAAVLGFSADGQTLYADDGLGTSVLRNGQWRSVTQDRPASSNPQTSVSADGRYFAWASSDGTIHLYDADAEEEVCVSCPADGSSGANARMMKANRSISNRTTRSLLDDGTVFFDSPTRLIAADHNGTRDVYAYRNGHLTLISPADQDFDAFFVDASEDGSSVFFQTSQGLVGQDTDGSADVYVARVGGGFASQNPLPPPGSCQGVECAEAGGQPAGGPPVNTAGPANLAIQHKKHKKKHKKQKKHKKKSKNHRHQGDKNKVRGN